MAKLGRLFDLAGNSSIEWWPELRNLDASDATTFVRERDRLIVGIRDYREILLTAQNSDAEDALHQLHTEIERRVPRFDEEAAVALNVTREIRHHAFGHDFEEYADQLELKMEKIVWLGDFFRTSSQGSQGFALGCYEVTDTI